MGRHAKADFEAIYDQEWAKIDESERPQRRGGRGARIRLGYPQRSLTLIWVSMSMSERTRSRAAPRSDAVAAQTPALTPAAR